MLYWNLALLHKFHLIHMDIKPDNLMLSPTFRKAVFIDFGLSRFIREQISYQSMTKFSGSYNFCSPEMAECFLAKKRMPVDLYYNDLHCLQATIKVLHSTSESSQNQYFSPEERVQYVLFNLGSTSHLTQLLSMPSNITFSGTRPLPFCNCGRQSPPLKIKKHLEHLSLSFYCS